MKLIASERKVTLSHDDLGKVEIEGKDFRTPQPESVDEAVSMCGGETGLLNFFGSALQDIAKRNSRTGFSQTKIAPESINTAEKKESFIKNLLVKILAAAENVSPLGAAANKTEKAQNFDVLAAAYARGDSPEQIMKLLETMK